MLDYIESPLLDYGDDFYQVVNDSEWVDSWYFCEDFLHKVFDFPEGTQEIQFRAFKEPGPNRVEVKFDFKVNDNSESNCFVKEKGWHYIIDETLGLIKALAKRRRTWYVELYYWE